MTDRFLRILDERFPLIKIPCDEFASLKVSGMKFKIEAYSAMGLGHVSVMKASGFFGLMKMETLMITPVDLDLPIYSYDRIHALGNDTLIIELYDTTFEKYDDRAIRSIGEELRSIKKYFSSIPDRDPGEHWYDSIKFEESISKKGKRAHTPDLDKLAELYFQTCFWRRRGRPTYSKDYKRDKINAYVNGLLEHGGPSTDVFKKALGEKKTKKLFKKVLFGIEM